ncbi:hypothetical protein BBP40_002643 [Aspergillus hancockii]|nr:hypothetical protein BBP40_002643 [Aspergillus hancockii]
MRRFSDENLEIRLIFWGAFVVDQIQSLYQGRPPSLQGADTNVPLTFLDRYEELEHWTPFAYSGKLNSRYPGSPAYSMSTFADLCKLSMVLNGILNKVYSEKSAKRCVGGDGLYLGSAQFRPSGMARWTPNAFEIR